MAVSLAPLVGSVALADSSATAEDAANQVIPASPSRLADSPTWPNLTFRQPVVVSSPDPQPAATTTTLVAANQATPAPASVAIPAASVITVSAALVPPPPVAGGAQPTPTHGGGGIVSIPQAIAQPTNNAAPAQARLAD